MGFHVNLEEGTSWRICLKWTSGAHHRDLQGCQPAQGTSSIGCLENGEIITGSKKGVKAESPDAEAGAVSK